MLEICLLASGSSGNAIYVATENTRILVDAGLSGKRLANALSHLDVCATSLDALLLSHDHNDHISGAGVMSRRYKLPIYATAPTWQVAAKKLGKLCEEHCRELPGQGSFAINDLKIETFPTPHDAAGSVGFVFRHAHLAVALVTDLGSMTELIYKSMGDMDVIILEANHDEQMLMQGSYPWHLKKRILGDYGHLSNTIAAEVLTKIISSKTKQVVLAHLSEENNLPQLAYNTVCERLETAGLKPGYSFSLEVAKRHEPSCYIQLAM